MDGITSGPSTPPTPADAEFERRLLAGTSTAMRDVARLARVASTYAVPVLIVGPSGSGKEHLARAIHYLGKRCHRPFVAVNCAALSESLLEAELFGSRRGAFSEALEDRSGLFVEAHRGTLFLDEIGDASPALQGKLLRALDSGEITAVGCDQSRRVDVRLLAATHQDLEHAIQTGEFRTDLYYRISTLTIAIPGLAERLRDLPEIAAHLLLRHSLQAGKVIPGFTAAALAQLTTHEWPGNLRELSNAIERAVALAVPGEPIDGPLLPARRHAPATIVPPAATARITAPRGAKTLRQARDEFERDYIRNALHRARGNTDAAAHALGLSRSMLRRKIRQFEIHHGNEDGPPSRA